MTSAITFPPGKRIRLADLDPADTSGIADRQQAKRETDAHIQAIDRLAYRMYGEDRRALLLVLQGMDCSGKDGTIRKVMSGINPQCCEVTSFRTPTAEELEHDFLWRIHRMIPRAGNIGIFNRSHYEDVIVVRVEKLFPKSVWKSRFEIINGFEKLLTEGYVTVVKVFLHISKDEQRKRLQERLDDPTMRWKFRLGDLDVRKKWDQYQAAYDDALTKCNTEQAPWHIVPAEHKWYRNLIVSRILHKTLKDMDPQFPPADKALDGIIVE